MQKNKMGLKNSNLNYKKREKKKTEEERKKKKNIPQNCKSPMQRQRFITTIKSVTEYTHIHIHP